jgi:hypothetical protein
MDHKKNKPPGKYSLIRGEKKPMSGVRIMQISGLNTSPALPVARVTTSPSGGNASDNLDRAEFNLSADSFSALVHKAGQMPEVRSELVDSFKARIQSGNYPSQDVIEGLTNLIGSGIMQAVKSGQ